MESAPELVSFMERMVKNWNASDAQATVDTYSRQPGLLAIGTDPDEWWEGFEAVSALLRVQSTELQSMGKAHLELGETVAWKGEDGRMDRLPWPTDDRRGCPPRMEDDLRRARRGGVLAHRPAARLDTDRQRGLVGTRDDDGR